MDVINISSDWITGLTTNNSSMTSYHNMAGLDDFSTIKTYVEAYPGASDILFENGNFDILHELELNDMDSEDISSKSSNDYYIDDNILASNSDNFFISDNILDELLPRKRNNSSRSLLGIDDEFLRSILNSNDSIEYNSVQNKNEPTISKTVSCHFNSGSNNSASVSTKYAETVVQTYEADSQDEEPINLPDLNNNPEPLFLHETCEETLVVLNDDSFNSSHVEDSTNLIDSNQTPIALVASSNSLSACQTLLSPKKPKLQPISFSDVLRPLPRLMSHFSSSSAGTAKVVPLFALSPSSSTPGSLTTSSLSVSRRVALKRRLAGPIHNPQFHRSTNLNSSISTIEFKNEPTLMGKKTLPQFHERPNNNINKDQNLSWTSRRLTSAISKTNESSNSSSKVLVSSGSSSMISTYSLGAKKFVTISAPEVTDTEVDIKESSRIPDLQGSSSAEDQQHQEIGLPWPSFMRGMASQSSAAHSNSTSTSMTPGGGEGSSNALVASSISSQQSLNLLLNNNNINSSSRLSPTTSAASAGTAMTAPGCGLLISSANHRRQVHQAPLLGTSPRCQQPGQFPLLQTGLAAGFSTNRNAANSTMASNNNNNNSYHFSASHLMTQKRRTLRFTHLRRPSSMKHSSDVIRRFKSLPAGLRSRALSRLLWSKQSTERPDYYRDNFIGGSKFW